MKKFWIKERHNPQSGMYYVACGQLPQKRAKKMEQSLYGWNFMQGFSSEEAYKARLEQLRKKGERVQ
jgi:hypothetical protein